MTIDLTKCPNCGAKMRLDRQDERADYMSCPRCAGGAGASTGTRPSSSAPSVKPAKGCAIDRAHAGAFDVLETMGGRARFRCRSCSTEFVDFTDRAAAYAKVAGISLIQAGRQLDDAVQAERRPVAGKGR
jgi:predicted nucleic acid-binding Zn ribbon protein